MVQKSPRNFSSFKRSELLTPEIFPNGFLTPEVGARPLCSHCRGRESPWRNPNPDRWRDGDGGQLKNGKGSMKPKRVVTNTDSTIFECKQNESKCPLCIPTNLLLL